MGGTALFFGGVGFVLVFLFGVVSLSACLIAVSRIFWACSSCLISLVSWVISLSSCLISFVIWVMSVFVVMG